VKTGTLLTLAGVALGGLLLRARSDREASAPAGPVLAPPPPPGPPSELAYGVPSGRITDPFYRSAEEKRQLAGKSSGRAQHLGMDVSTSNQAGGGPEDPRRGLPVYAQPRFLVNVHDLNQVRAVDSQGQPQTGLSIPGSGQAMLQHAVVLVQPWTDTSADAYGGVVGLACRYQGPAGVFTLYLEFLHLITQDFPPRDGKGQPIAFGDWIKTGKGFGFGPKAQNNQVLPAGEFGGNLLIGYLGATAFPHVHIQAAYGPGVQRYIKRPRFDPTVMLS